VSSELSAQLTGNPADNTTAVVYVSGVGSFGGFIGNPWTNFTGAGSEVMAPGYINGLELSTTYYVVWDTASSTFMALTDYNDTLDDSYIFCGKLTTVSNNVTDPGGTTGGGGQFPARFI
jgi:hypothetical protein